MFISLRTKFIFSFLLSALGAPLVAGGCCLPCPCTDAAGNPITEQITRAALPNKLTPKEAPFLHNVQEYRTSAVLRRVFVTTKWVPEHKGLSIFAYAHGLLVAKSLIKIIGAYDEQVAIWEKIQDGPIWYRFKRAPWHWFGGESSRRELAGYLVRLKGKRSACAKALARLNRALHVLHDAIADPAGRLEETVRLFVCDLMGAVASAFSGEERFVSDPGNFISLKHMLHEQIASSIGYEQREHAAFKQLNLPGHVQRNITPYLLGTAAVVGTAAWLWWRRDKLPEWREQIDQRWSFVCDYFCKKYETFKSALWNLHEYTEKVGNDRVRKAEQNVKNICDIVTTAYPQKTEADVLAFVETHHGAGTLESLIDECDRKTDSLYLRLFWWKQWITVKKDIAKARLGFAEERLYEGFEKISERVDRVDPSIAVLAIGVPSALLYYSGCAAYGWLTSKKKIYRTIRHTLLRMRTLFGTPSGGMDDESEGMLVYLLAQLQTVAHRVPRADRQQFQADLEFFGGDALDVHKVQRIDAMLGPYRFISS